ncbi:MAG TPA: hypothetical protein VHA82_17680 [Ramlibacter sp.]|uniref:hypothetical protein n=1 Tax=Ramlibacter sp. TaxID=1917967 RepID=UPI002C08ED14|nr:hypothetical protein [Ramlibacter sp.]HVZ45642.1 hypothetical protein [Ramlibacter sp.]
MDAPTLTPASRSYPLASEQDGAAPPQAAVIHVRGERRGAEVAATPEPRRTPVEAACDRHAVTIRQGRHVGCYSAYLIVECEVPLGSPGGRALVDGPALADKARSAQDIDQISLALRRTGIHFHRRNHFAFRSLDPNHRFYVRED